MTRKALFLLILMLGVLSWNSAVIQAADQEDAGDSDSSLSRTIESPEYYQMEKDFQDKKSEAPNVVDKTNKQDSATPDSNVTIFVARIQTDSSAILSNEEIAAITSKYEGKAIGIRDLYQALKEIDELYVKKGFITAQAILPPQKIQDGIVIVKLVEAHFGEFILEGNEHTKDTYILKRFTEDSGDLVNINTLEKDIMYFNLTNDVQIKAELKPGKEFGLTDCVLTVQEPANLQGSVFTNNGGGINTGEYQLGFNFVDNSLFGHRDSLVISPLRTQGTTAGTISYGLPINTRGTRLGVSYSKNQSSVINGTYENLDIKSNETDLGLQLSHPFIVSPNLKMDGYASYYKKASVTDFQETELIDYQVNTFSLGIDLQKIDQKGFWYNRLDITRGSSDICESFLKFNVSAVRQQRIGDDRFMVYRFAGQISNNHLLPSTEQFGIGGMTTVRGYHTSLLSGDKGFNLGVEYNFPIKILDKTQGFVFLDYGGAFPYKGDGKGITKDDYLTSIGVGANFKWTKYLSGKIDIAYPISPPEGEDGVRIEFFLQTRLF